jgi:hypothetical protein
MTSHLYLVLRSRVVELYLQTLVVFTAVCLMNQAQGQLHLYLLFQTLVESMKGRQEVLTAELMKSCAFWKDLWEISWCGMDWINLAQGRDQ